jgi:two-component system, NarL family, response regulator LiaR
MVRSDLLGGPVRAPCGELETASEWTRSSTRVLARSAHAPGVDSPRVKDLGGSGQMPAQHESTERPRPITVVVVDDEQMIRGALAQTLTGGGLYLVGEAANAQDALRVVVDVRPDVVLMDLRLPDSSGVQTIEQLTRLAPASRILILTRTEQNRVVEAIVAGASGYILKTAPPKAIIAAVRATAAGESVISSQIAGKLLQRIRERDIPVTTTSDNAASAIRAVLTERELEIFERLASGKSNHDIAHELSLSTNTVHNHIASILAKLHLDNRIQAAVQAVRSGIS